MSEKEIWKETYELIDRLDNHTREKELRATAKELYPFIKEMLMADMNRRKGGE